MSEDEDYVCSLDQASIKKAKDELNEVPEDRLAAVQAFRDWIKAQPHIKCPQTDTLTMLRFLRGTKFSQLKAREKFEAFLSMKVTNPQWAKDVDAYDPTIKAIIATGYCTLLPKRLPDGCLGIIYRLAKLGELIKNGVGFKDMIRFGILFIEYIGREEMTQVNGMVFLIDFTGVTAGMMTNMMSSESAKFHKIQQKSAVGRFKAFHDYNAGLFIDALMTFYRPFMPKKWMDRIVLHDTMESVYRHIPKDCLPIEFLPDDYTGPNVGYLDDLNKKMATDFSDQKLRDEVLFKSSDAFWVDESKRPTETVTQHFRKLNVD